MPIEIFEVTILGLIAVILVIKGLIVAWKRRPVFAVAYLLSALWVGAGIWAFYVYPKIWTYPFILPGIVTNIIYSRRYPGKEQTG